MEFEHKDDIRNTIILEASKLFIQQGYTKTTIRQIAQVCNLGRGHLYYYFKKKKISFCISIKT
ncbi:helix-turn-helix domain-containing protein [Paraclostridium bifermentans]|uniref:Helix-turn-helix domain-containing protein n=1 Tax=Paraclostridium bifermentans TaxID=1490 RepID=A0ABY8R6S9_PARBF|nr:helix-turn-helix domain-containing protein [Paraclostridium bifermentans]